MKFTVLRDTNELEQQVWVFMLYERYSSDIVLSINGYRTERRATKRHKWQYDYNQPRYVRGDRHLSDIPIEQVPLPEDVVEEAKAKALAGIKFEP